MKKRIFKWRLNRQIRKANKYHKLTRFKYMVILWKGRPVALPKRTVKEWIKTKKLNTTMAHVEKYALYIT